jgi:hypothetical protein
VDRIGARPVDLIGAALGLELEPHAQRYQPPGFYTTADTARLFDPEQLQGHALVPQLPVHLRPIRLRAYVTWPGLLPSVQQRFQRRVVHRRRQGPAQPRRLRPGGGCRSPCCARSRGSAQLGERVNERAAVAPSVVGESRWPSASTTSVGPSLSATPICVRHEEGATRDSPDDPRLPASLRPGALKAARRLSSGWR